MEEKLVIYSGKLLDELNELSNYLTLLREIITELQTKIKNL